MKETLKYSRNKDNKHNVRLFPLLLFSPASKSLRQQIIHTRMSLINSKGRRTDIFSYHPLFSLGVYNLSPHLPCSSFARLIQKSTNRYFPPPFFSSLVINRLPVHYILFVIKKQYIIGNATTSTTTSSITRLSIWQASLYSYDIARRQKLKNRHVS